MVFRCVATVPVTQPQAGLPSEQGAVSVAAVAGPVRVRPGQGGVSGALLFRPELAVADINMPLSFRVEGNGQSEKVARPGLDATVQNQFLAHGSLNGPDATFLQGTGLTPIGRFLEPPGLKLVKLSGPGDQAIPITITADLMQPQIILQNGQSMPAVGAIVRWQEGDANFTHLVYNPPGSQGAEEAIGAQAQREIMPVLEDFSAHRAATTTLTLLFLVPNGSVVTSFKLAGSASPINLESPMSAGQ